MWRIFFTSEKKFCPNFSKPTALLGCYFQNSQPWGSAEQCGGLFYIFMAEEIEFRTESQEFLFEFFVEKVFLEDE